VSPKGGSEVVEKAWCFCNWRGARIPFWWGGRSLSNRRTGPYRPGRTANAKTDAWPSGCGVKCRPYEKQHCPRCASKKAIIQGIEQRPRKTTNWPWFQGAAQKKSKGCAASCARTGALCVSSASIPSSPSALIGVLVLIRCLWLCPGLGPWVCPWHPCPLTVRSWPICLRIPLRGLGRCPTPALSFSDLYARCSCASERGTNACPSCCHGQAATGPKARPREGARAGRSGQAEPRDHSETPGSPQ